MIAIDTNVLLRYLLNDDPKQSPIEKKLIAGDADLLVTDIVLVETLWTLRGKKYGLKKDDLAAVVSALFEETNIHFEDAPAVWTALSAYQAGKTRGGKHPDFSDALIIEKAKQASSNTSAGFEGMATFDKAAQRLDGAFDPGAGNV